MATKQAFGGFDHLTVVPENFDPDSTDARETDAETADADGDAVRDR